MAVQLLLAGIFLMVLDLAHIFLLIHSTLLFVED
jgi:hypothetical protein